MGAKKIQDFPEEFYPVYELEGKIATLDKATGETRTVKVVFTNAKLVIEAEEDDDFEVLPGIVFHGQARLTGHIDFESFQLQQPKPKRPKVEGEPGTWSHCGNMRPHPAHPYTFAMNEGPYHVTCGGTPHGD